MNSSQALSVVARVRHLVFCTAAAAGVFFTATAPASNWIGASANWSVNTNPGWNGTGVPNAVGAIAINSVSTTGTTTQNFLLLTVGLIERGGTGNNLWTISNNLQDVAIRVDQDEYVGAGSAIFRNSNTGSGTGNAFFITGQGKIVLNDNLRMEVTGANSTNVNGAMQIDSPIKGYGNIAYTSNYAIPAANSSSVAGGIRLARVNTFVGNSTIEKGLVFAMGTASAFGDASNQITIGVSGLGSAAVLSRDNTSPINYGITIGTGLVGEGRTFGSNAETSYTVSTGNINMLGDLTLRAGTASTTAVQTYAGNFSGAGALTKTGTAIARLTGSNSYGGKTTVSGGTLNFAQPSALYNGISGSWTTGNIVVSSGAVLSLSAGGGGEFTPADILLIGGLGSGSGGFAAGSFLGVDTTSGNVVLPSGINNANAMGLVKSGINNLTINGASNYAGGTNVLGGTLTLGANDAIGTGTVTVPTGGTLDLGTFSQTSGAVTLSGGTITGSTGVLSGASYAVESGTVSGNLGGTGNLTKTTAGTVTLSGNNTYSGTTTVTAGTLQLTKPNSFYNNQQGGLAGYWSDSTKFTVESWAPGVVDTSASIPGGVLGFNIGSGGEFSEPDIAAINATGSASGGFKNNSYLGINPTTASYAYATPITNSFAGANAVGLMKTGSNTLVLTGVNTYTGPTSFYNGTLAISGGNDRISTASKLAFNPTNVAGSTGTFDLGSNNQTLADLTLNDALGATASTSTLNITGTGTLTLGANDLAIGAGSNVSLNNATAFHQILNMSGLSNFVFNNSAKNVHIGLNWIESSAATKATNVATVTFATNNTITAGTLGFADNGGGSGGGTTTANLGQTNVWNVNTIDMGITRSDLNLQFNTGLVNPTLNIRAADGTSAVTQWTLGNVNDTSNRLWDDNVNVSGGTVDALVTNMVIGQASPHTTTRDGTVTANFTMGKGTFTVNSLILGQFAAQTAGQGTDTTMRGAGTFTLNNSLGTLNATTILLGDVPQTVATGGTSKTASGTLAVIDGTVKSTTISRGSQVGVITGGVVTTSQVDFTGGTVQNTDGASLAINDVSVRLLSNTGTRKFNATGNNTIALNAGTVISGIGSFNKSGSGMMTLAGANTHTGGSYADEGVLKIVGAGTFGGAGVRLGSNATGIVDLNGMNPTVGTLDGNGGRITSNALAAVTLTVGGADATGGEYFGSITNGTANLTGDYNLNGIVDAADYALWRNDPLTYGGTPNGYNDWRANFGATGGPVPGGAFTLVKTGFGTVTTSGTNTYTGTTTVQAGALVLGSPNSLYNNQQGSFAGAWNTTNIVVEPNATLGFRVGAGGNFTEAQIAALQASLGSPTGGFKPGSSLGISPAVASYAYTSAIGNSGSSVTGLTKLGPNTLTVSSANTYGGNTQVAEGVLSVSQIGNVGAVSGQLGAPATAAVGAIRLGSSAGVTGTLRYTGAGETSDRELVAWGAAGANGEVEAAGAGALTISGNVTAAAGGAKTLTLTGASTGANTLSGAITDGASVLSMAKNGTGSWVLGGANTYSGTTNVTGGNLKITGSHTGGGIYSIARTAGSNATVSLDGGAAGALSITHPTASQDYMYLGTDGGNGTFNQVDGTVTIGAGAGTPELYVGYLGGTGTYNLTAGTLDLKGYANIGRDGGNGTVNVSSGATMIVQNELRVGAHYSATGGLGVVNNSGSITTGQLYIGPGNSPNTSLGKFFAESGSVTTINGPIRMGAGNGGVAELTINGGQIFTQTVAGPIQVGYNTGGVGTFTLNDGFVSCNDWVVIGAFGTGVGHGFQHGGTINTVNFDMAQAVGAVGDYTMDSTISPSSIVTSGFMTVGDFGAASFYMKDGTISVGTQYYVGYAGPGHFQQDAGIVTVANFFSISRSAGSVSDVDMNGGDFSVVGDYNIGDYGTGTLDMSGGNIDTTGGTGFVLGYQASAVGVANISGGDVMAGLGSISGTGAGSDIRIGNVGQGTLNLSGGKMESTDWAYVGTNAGGRGTFNLSGTGLFKPGDNMAIGYNLSTVGVMNMTGGTLEMIGNDPSLASATSFGTGDLTVGREGTGTLNMSAGTINLAVTVVGTPLTGADNDTFNSASASVAYNIAGLGGELRHALDGNLYVGERRGTGVMTQSGGTTNVGANVFVGGFVLVGADLVGGKGTLTISGGEMHVGQLPVSFTNQSPTGGDFVLGSPATLPISEATVNLTGGLLDVAHTDPTDTYGGNIASGGGGTLAFNFTGGTLKVRRWNQLGPFGGSLGNLVQNGAGSLLDITGNDTTLLQTSQYDLGAGTATIGNGRTFTTNGVINSAGAGVINVGQGGAAATLTAGAGAIAADTITLSSGSVTAAGGVTVATLANGNGSFNNSVTLVSGAKVAAGLSVGTLNFLDDLTLDAASEAIFEFNGNASFDKINVSDILTLAGELKLNVIGVTPTVGQAFDILDWVTLSGTFATVPSSSYWDTTDLYTLGVVKFVALPPGSGSGLDGGAVPEPSVLVLLALAAGGLCGRRRRA